LNPITISENGINRKQKKYQDFGNFIFELNLDKIDLSLNVPYLYHARILNLINYFVLNLEDGLKIILEITDNTFNLKYLFYLISRKDFFFEDNTKYFLNFILKLEVLKLI